MQRRKPAGLHSRWRIPEPPQSLFTLTAMAASAALPLYALTTLVPRELVLPALCLIAVAGAAIASLVAWRRGSVRNPQRVTAWDVAGALAFVACAAAILSDPQQIVALGNAATAMSDIADARIALSAPQ
jgi:Na+/melibiose symporter-like transporter